MNAYNGATTSIKMPAGETRAIPIRAGVKQGCPLSPILFNLCIEVILQRVKAAAAKLQSGSCVHYGTALSRLAYADDLVIVARGKVALQLLLDAASDAAHIVGLSFRPDKCATLSLTSTKQCATFVDQQDFLIQGNHIPALAQEQSYRYLGVPVGLSPCPTFWPQLLLLALIHLLLHVLLHVLLRELLRDLGWYITSMTYLTLFRSLHGMLSSLVTLCWRRGKNWTPFVSSFSHVSRMLLEPVTLKCSPLTSTSPPWLVSYAMSALSRTMRHLRTFLLISEWEAWPSKNCGPSVTSRPLFRLCAFCFRQIRLLLPWQDKH